MRYLLLLLLFLGPTLACAQLSGEELPYLIIPPTQLPERFREFEKQQLTKILLKGCAKQPGYQVIIGDPPAHKKTKWQMFRVDVKVSYDPEKQTFTVDAALVEARKNKIFNRIVEGEIPELEFFRRFELIIDRLFLPPPVTVEETPLEKLPPPKKPVPKDEAAIAAQEVETADLNFRERVQQMRTDVDLAVLNASKVAREAQRTESKDKEHAKKKPSAGAVDSEAELKNPSTELPPLKKNPPPIDVGHSLRLGYYSFKTNSVHNRLNTDASPKYVFLDYEYARPWELDSDLYHHFNVRTGKVVNREEKEFAPYLGFGLWEGFFFNSLHWMPKLGLEMDTISFSNLPEIGKGLKVGNNRIFWTTVSSVNNFALFNRGFRLTVSFGLPVKVMSDYAPLKDQSLSGSKINVTLAALNVFRNYHLELNYFTSNLSADIPNNPLTFSTSGVGINAFYHF